MIRKEKKKKSLIAHGLLGPLILLTIATPHLEIPNVKKKGKKYNPANADHFLSLATRLQSERRLGSIKRLYTTNCFLLAN
jgi:hypothetical protein